MEMFFRQFVAIPESVLFADQERYEDAGSPGCGWIPRTILSRYSPSALPFQGVSRYDADLITFREKVGRSHLKVGLSCRLDGIEVHSVEIPKRFQIQHGDCRYNATCRRAGRSEVRLDPLHSFCG